MIHWQLSQTLAEQGIANSRQLQAALEQRLGVSISSQALYKLLKENPVFLRLETAQLLCNLLQKPLDSFLIITPDPPPASPHGRVIKPYTNATPGDEPGFADPARYFR